MKKKQGSVVAATPSAVVGRGPADFCREAGCGRSSLYNMPHDAWPEHVRIGRKIIIVESPRDWLTRMRARGGVTMVKKTPSSPAA